MMATVRKDNESKSRKPNSSPMSDGSREILDADDVTLSAVAPTASTVAQSADTASASFVPSAAMSAAAMHGAAGGMMAEQGNLYPEWKDSDQSLDFIGTSQAVKSLFSVPYSTDRPLCIAVHNMDGTLVVDMEDENAVDVERDYLFDNGRATPSLPAQEAGSQLPQAESEYSLDALALPGNLSSNQGLESFSLLSDIIEKQKNQSPVLRIKDGEAGNEKGETVKTRDEVEVAVAPSSLSDSSSIEIKPGLGPSSDPREYIQWKFQDLKLLVGSNAIIARPPPSPPDFEGTSPSPTGLTIRVEDTQKMKMLLEKQKSMVQQGQFVSDHYHYLSKLHGCEQAEHLPSRPTYAQALLTAPQEEPKAKNDQDRLHTPLQISSSSFSAPNLAQVKLQTCSVPSPGRFGEILQDSSFVQSSDRASSTKNVGSSTLPSSPISPVSVVLDAYLDNVMANVPQLALCLREKGFIQSVKLLETNAIPSSFLHSSTIDSSKPFDQVRSSDDDIFSPQIMEMNASALLRFLQANCTRNNATYLLRREAGQANVQLYDISSISTQRQRKWIWWLATMSYRFALRLRHLEASLHGAPEAQKRGFRDRQRSLYRTTLDLLEDLNDMDERGRESLIAAVYDNLADTFLADRNAEEGESKEEEGSDRKDTLPDSSAMHLASPSTLLPLQQHPFRAISPDALSKAQDHLSNGIKSLWPMMKKILKVEARARKRQSAKRSRQRSRSSSKQISVESGSSENDEGEHDQDACESVAMQLLSLHHKLINVTLRLAEHHLQNYFSSSAMQALRSAARRMSDCKTLLRLLRSNKEQSNLLARRLQVQLQWLWENCGQFARSFASDDLWRERGHACGDDVISVLRDVEAAFAVDENELLEGIEEEHLAPVPPCLFSDESKDMFYSKTSGMVTLHSISALIEPSILLADHKMPASLFPPSKSVQYALSVLNQQRQLQRDSRQVLVASCLSYSRSVTAFETLFHQLEKRPVSKSNPTPLINAADLATLNLLLQRLGDACNETGKTLLDALRSYLGAPSLDKKSSGGRFAAEALLSSAQFWFLTGLEAFERCHDLANVALLRCNLCQCYKLRANSNFACDTYSIVSVPDGSSHAEVCLQEAANHLQAAHEALGQRDVNPRTWDMVSNELAATFLVLGVRRRQSLLGGGNTPVITRLAPGKERSIIEPLEQALKIYELSANAHQAAAAHYQLAFTNSKIWTCQRDEAKTREKLSAAFFHYNAAYSHFRDLLRGNEPTFVLICLDLAGLYSAVSGEEGLGKALTRCLDVREAFSEQLIDSALLGLSASARNDWLERMQTLAVSAENQAFKLLRSLVKLESEGGSGDRFKKLYRTALSAKMVQNVPITSEDDDVNESVENKSKSCLLSIHGIFSSIAKEAAFLH